MTDFPHDPVGPPSLIRGDENGQYMVDLSDAAPHFVNGQPSNWTIVAFLFRLEEVNSHNVSFTWMVRLMVLYCSFIAYYDSLVLDNIDSIVHGISTTNLISTSYILLVVKLMWLKFD